jgi:uncharacterized protein YjbJ (UPF0337 family)
MTPQTMRGSPAFHVRSVIEQQPVTRHRTVLVAITSLCGSWSAASDPGRDDDDAPRQDESVPADVPQRHDEERTLCEDDEDASRYDVERRFDEEGRLTKPAASFGPRPIGPCLEHGVYDYRNLTQWRSFNSVTLSSHEHKRLIMGNTTGKIAGAANQAAGKVKEGLGKATLETEGLAQEAMAKAERVIGDASPAVKRTLNDHTISIVAAILILTVLIQVILVKSWT